MRMQLWWIIHMCVIIDSYVCHKRFIRVTDAWLDECVCVTWLIYIFRCNANATRMPHSHIESLIYIRDITHSYVWHDSFTYVSWPIHMCDMTHSYVWHDPFPCIGAMEMQIEWLIHMCVMTHSYVWHDSFIRVTWLIHMYTCNENANRMNYSYVWRNPCICVTWLIHTCDVTHSCV